MKFFRKTIIFILMLAIFCPLLSSCTNTGNTNNQDEFASGNVSAGEVVDNEVTTHEDSFVTLEFDGLDVQNTDVLNLEINDLILETIDVEEIDMLEIELTTINDEFVHVAYHNFVSFYGMDIDLGKLIKDIAIATGVVVVMVSITVLTSGAMSTFFGAVLASELSQAAVLVSAAIDAAIAGYKAIQEGGDLSYVIGHMIQGVADGFKWGAILAPLTGIASGIKAIKAFNALKKVPYFEEINIHQARAIFEGIGKIAKKTAKLADNVSDDALKVIFKEMSGELSEEITESMFINIFKNSSSIIGYLKKYNPFNLSSKISQELKEAFLSKSGISDDVAKKIIKNIQSKTIKSLNDLDSVTSEYVKNNMAEFVELFGKHMSKEFVENCLENNLGKSIFNIVKESILNKNLYSDLIESSSKDVVDKILSDYATLLLLQLRYGGKNVVRLLNTKELYTLLLRDNLISHSNIKSIINGLYDGSLKSLDDISKINKQVVNNMTTSREIIISLFKELGISKQLTNIVDELVSNKILMHVKNDIINYSIISDILSKSLTKSQIIDRYGQKIYNELVEKSEYIIEVFGMQAKVNQRLIKEMMEDTLLKKNISEEVISMILSGSSIQYWGLADDIVCELSHITGIYYKSIDFKTYNNFIHEIAEVRGQNIADFLKEYFDNGKTLINSSYAGKVHPYADSYLYAKYGDIRYSSYGFVIFDQYAIASVKISDLTGLNGGADDIARANLMHHGTKYGVPGYTWHHLEDGETLILVPTELHEAHKHTGGASLLREGLKR